MAAKINFTIKLTLAATDPPTAIVVRHHPATMATMATGEEELMGAFCPARCRQL